MPAFKRGPYRKKPVLADIAARLRSCVERGSPVVDIAEEMGMDPGTVHSRLTRLGFERLILTPEEVAEVKAKRSQALRERLRVA